MKKTILFLITSVPIYCLSQVGINTTNPDAQLDVVATDQTAPTNKDGLLVPRIDDFPLTNPTANQNGMLVFVTGNGAANEGFHYWDNGNTTWMPLTTTGVEKIDDLTDGKSDANGSSVFLGQESGQADDGSNNQNVGIGFRSLYNNTSGGRNSAVGYLSLFNNTTSSGNTATGYQSLYNTTGGTGGNTANGSRSLYSNTTGSYNVAIGDRALYSNTTGYQNVANGSLALYNNTTGVFNTAMGHYALFNNTTSLSNTAIGYYSLYNTTSGANTGVGSRTLFDNTTGAENVAVGSSSLSQNTTGGFNVSVGSSSSIWNTAGSNNTAVGDRSLFYNDTGSYNTALGKNAFRNGTNYSNSTALGYNTEITASNMARFGNASVSSIGGYANWTNVSDGRFKTNVMENVPGLDFILKLRPITYQLDLNAIAAFYETPEETRLKEAETLKSNELQTGFIAQEVEKAAKSINYNFHGVDKPQNEESHYGLRYAEFVVPLVKAIQEQQEKILLLEKEINQLKGQKI